MKVPVMGVVSLEGMEFYAGHGYYQEERVIGNKYSVDVFLELDCSKAVADDKLDGTVNYEEVYSMIRKVMSVNAHLLEHLAGKIVNALKEKFPQLVSIKVKVSKYNPPIKGLCEKATVTLKG